MSPTLPKVDPSLREALIRSAQLAAAHAIPDGGIAGMRHSMELARKYWNEGGPLMNAIRRLRIPVEDGAVSIMVYRPVGGQAHLPAFVYLHGGGFKTGSERTNDRQMREIAKAWGGIVVSADYVHAPEYRFPLAVEQTASLLHELHARGNEWGIDGDRLACGGCSAGANVSFGAAVALGRRSWLRAAVGIVGAFSGDTSTDSMCRYGNVDLFPDLASIPSIFGDYLNGEASGKDPRVNLLLADPARLPTTFLAAAEFDVFLDASSVMARSLDAAGRLDRLKVYRGMTHLFFGFSRSVESAAECTRDIGDFLARMLPP